MTLKVGSLFSGIGGLEKGFADVGCEVVFQVELDEGCRSVLTKHWPDVKQYDDIREVTYERLKRDLGRRADVDVLVGGWPCQDISLAGPRLGLAGARSGLFYEFARLAKEIAPRWLVAENVPGLLSSGCVPPCPGGCVETHGGDMGAVIGTLGELGYGYAWRVLDAQYLGVPQRRRRIFIVGHLGAPWSAPAEVLLEPESREGDPAEGDEAWEDDAPPVGEGAPGLGPGGREGELVSALTSVHGGPDDNMAQAGHLVPTVIGVGSESTPDVAGTLGSAGQGRGWNSDLDRMAALVVDEDPNTETVLIGSEYGDKVARPVTACAHGHRYDMETENLLVQPKLNENQEHETVYAVHNGDDVLISEDVAMPVMGGAKGLPQAVTFRKSQRAHHAEDCETWVEDETANTLNAFENHNAERTTHAIVTPLDLSQACRTNTDTGVGTPGTGIGEEGGPSYPVGASKAVPAMIQELSVRRLTPLECERLQGFPDNWTEGHSDSARYKQLGNAVAVPCSRWIATRLLEVDAQC